MPVLHDGPNVERKKVTVTTDGYLLNIEVLGIKHNLLLARKHEREFGTGLLMKLHLGNLIRDVEQAFFSATANRILKFLEDGPKSAKEICLALDLDPTETEYLAPMRILARTTRPTRRTRRVARSG